MSGSRIAAKSSGIDWKRDKTSAARPRRHCRPWERNTVEVGNKFD